MSAWLLFPVISAPMPLQMAIDEILFRRLEFDEGIQPPTYFRFYYSSEPWVTTGYSYEREGYERPNIAKGIPICKRLTGGGYVDHTKDLIFSVIARKNADESFKSVRMSYLKIHEAVKMAIETLGVAADFYRCDENLPKGASCFSFPIATDLSVNGKKIAGGSQKRSGGVMLHQESLQPIIGVEHVDLLSALRKGFEARFEIKFQSAVLDPKLLKEADALAKEKYPRINA